VEVADSLTYSDIINTICITVLLSKGTLKKKKRLERKCFVVGVKGLHLDILLLTIALQSSQAVDQRVPS